MGARLVPRAVGGLGYASLLCGALVQAWGDVSAHDDSVTRGHLCQVWGASLSGWYGTSGCGPSGGRGRHGVGQRGDPGSGAGHWRHSRKKAQTWPSMRSCGPKGSHVGLGSTMPRRSPQAAGSAPRPRASEGGQGHLARQGGRVRGGRNPGLPFKHLLHDLSLGPWTTRHGPSRSQHIPPSSLSQQQPDLGVSAHNQGAGCHDPRWRKARGSWAGLAQPEAQASAPKPASRPGPEEAAGTGPCPLEQSPNKPHQPSLRDRRHTQEDVACSCHVVT